MTDEFLCPECGGVIGATEATAAGKPCTCVTQSPSNADTAVLTAQSTTPKKVCCQCGVDVTGKKRLKDSRGYWCYDCHKKDLEKQGQTRVQITCPDCGESFDEQKMIQHGGSLLCKECYRHRLRHEDDESDLRVRQHVDKRPKKRELVRYNAYDDTVMKRIKIGLMVCFVLGLISAYRWGWLGGTADESQTELQQLMSNVKFMGVFVLLCIVGFIWWLKRQL
jgi:transcription initiation factor IIE alpha subunit